jgi:hypothetical protein
MILCVAETSEKRSVAGNMRGEIDVLVDIVLFVNVGVMIAICLLRCRVSARLVRVADRLPTSPAAPPCGRILGCDHAPRQTRRAVASELRPSAAYPGCLPMTMASRPLCMFGSICMHLRSLGRPELWRGSLRVS